MTTYKVIRKGNWVFEFVGLANERFVRMRRFRQPAKLDIWTALALEELR